MILIKWFCCWHFCVVTPSCSFLPTTTLSPQMSTWGCLEFIVSLQWQQKKCMFLTWQHANAIVQQLIELTNWWNAKHAWSDVAINWKLWCMRFKFWHLLQLQLLTRTSSKNQHNFDTKGGWIKWLFFFVLVVLPHMRDNNCVKLNWCFLLHRDHLTISHANVGHVTISPSAALSGSMHSFCSLLHSTFNMNVNCSVDVHWDVQKCQMFVSCVVVLIFSRKPKTNEECLRGANEVCIVSSHHMHHLKTHGRTLTRPLQ